MVGVEARVVGMAEDLGVGVEVVAGEWQALETG